MGVFRSGRRGPTQNELAVRGLMLVGAFALLLVVMTMSVGGAFADTTSVRAELDTAGGSIVSGSDVKFDGLVVGSGQARSAATRTASCSTSSWTTR